MPIRLTLILTMAWALALSPRPTRAAEPTTQPAPARLVHLQELTFDLGFEARYERRSTVSDRRGRSTFRFRQLNEQRVFIETIGMAATGELINERVLRFDINARWGLSQESFYERRPGPNLDTSPDGDLLEYDFHLDILPAGKISATVFGSQLDDRIPRAFLPSLTRRRERYGAGLSFNDRKLPMRLDFEHLFDEIRGRDALLDNEQFARDTLSYEATWQIDTDHTLRLEYEYDDRKERFSGLNTRFETRRHYLTLDHTLRFGDTQQHRVDTLFRYQDESGNLARDTVEIAPRLRLQHTPEFATTYGAQYLRETFEDFRIQQWRGDIGAIHQLGESLTSTFNLYGMRQDTDDRDSNRGGGIDTTDWGGSANFAFARKNKLGRFTANFGYTHNRVRTSDDRLRGIVIAESVTLSDGKLAFLAHDNVRRLSLVVTNATRTRRFFIGRDYIVVPVGRFTSIRRVRSGRITDGQTVLVSYTYRAFDDFELSRDRFDVRVQQEFKFGLTPYYAGSIQDEDLSRSRLQTFGARNVNRHRFGATFRKPRWSAGIEYEFHDETIDPFQAIHVNGDWAIVEDAKHQLSARTRLSHFRFDGSRDLLDRNTTLFDVGMSYRYLFGRDFEANASADYRFENDSLFGRTQGVDLASSLAYKIGLFSVLLEVEYDLLDLPGSRDRTFAVWLKLRREIPVLTRASR